MKENFKKDTDIDLLKFGKIPPQAKELEVAVLGAIMMERDAIDEVFDILKPECFYVETHKDIYQIMIDFRVNGKPIDLITISEECQKRQINITQYEIAMLQDGIASTANIRFHAAIIYQKYMGREGIKAALNIANRIYNGDEDELDLVIEANTKFRNIVDGLPTTNISTVADLIPSQVLHIEKVWNKEIPIGLMTGIYDIDKGLGGLRGGELIVLAARPGMGKSALMTQIASNLQKDGHPSLIYSYEMSKESLLHRMLSNWVEIDSEKLRDGLLNLSEMEKLKAYKWNDTPIYINDSNAVTADAIFMQAQKMKGRIKCIFVDYIQIMKVPISRIKGDLKTKDLQIGYSTSLLKQIAKTLNVPIIALAQLKRDVDKAANKKATLADLRESGNIEQDADVVCFLNRPEAYGIFEDGEGNDIRGLAKLDCAKNRNGKLFEANMRFIGQYSRFETLHDDTDFYNNQPPQEKYKPISQTVRDITRSQTNSDESTEPF